MVNLDYIKKNVTGIVVLYDSTNEILDCLKQLSQIDIIIIDNGKCNSTLIKKILSFKNIRYIKAKKNLGFGRANNFAFKLVKTQYALLINADVKTSINDLIALVNGMIKYPKTGITVPNLINDKNLDIDYLEILPEISKTFPKKKSYKNYHEQNLIKGDACIFFCWGAIMLLNTEIIKKIGLFNKKYFLFWEDYDLCRKLYFKKIPIVKIYNSKARHLRHKSVKKGIYNYFIIEMYHIYSSYIYHAVNKNEGRLNKKLLIYLFRIISYILIFNLKRSIKNLARFCAVIKYKFEL